MQPKYFTDQYILNQIREIDDLLELCKQYPQQQQQQQQQQLQKKNINEQEEICKARCCGCNVVLDSISRMYCGSRFECSQEPL